ncbi:Uncharacterised protein [Bordetella pertussis]|nr:Uncharacterised protein [Bordetella pertussis]
MPSDITATRISSLLRKWWNRLPDCRPTARASSRTVVRS